MSALLPFSSEILFAGVYAVALLVLVFMNRREFKRRPEKGARYRALPMRYKVTCWFVVVPLFAGTIIEGALFIPAVASFVLIEAACVRWYREAGLLP
jgi:hypothetical protein